MKQDLNRLVALRRLRRLRTEQLVHLTRMLHREPRSLSTTIALWWRLIERKFNTCRICWLFWNGRKWEQMINERSETYGR